MITAALNDELNKVDFEKDPIFGFMMPKTCPGVPSKILNPANTWENKDAYDVKASDLARQFVENFKKYESGLSEEILSAAPVVG